MTVFVVCEHLGRTDTFLVEVFHVVACCTVEEVISTHTQPEQMNLTVRVVGIVIYATRQCCRSERAIAAQVRELVEIGQANHQSLVTTT